MKKLSTLFLLLVMATNAVSQSNNSKTPKEKTPLVLEYTFLDLPFAAYAGRTVNCTVADPDAKVSLFKGMQYQSMQQATQISTGITQSANWGITQIPMFKKKPIVKKVTQNLIAGIVDIILMQTPFNAGWAHEEFHRNVMAVNYTNSFNPLTFNKREGTVGNGLASVAFVMDTNLVLLKKNSNPDLVRLEAAGGEGQIYGAERLQRQDFFYQQKLPNSFYYIFQFQNVQVYLATCANKDESTKTTEEQIAKEGARQELRDFTGLDFSGWAYDLWHPNEPYSARGLNPYGNGYDRYTKGTDLTAEQLSWLKKQSKLSQLNYISPMVFFQNSITLKTYGDGKKMKGNFSFRYYPTSFGNSLGLDLMLKTRKYNFFVSPHINQNYSHNFPGIEAMLFEYPVIAGNQRFLTTVDIIANLQPQNQSFFTKASSFTGYASANVKWRASKIFYPYIGISGKTKGWIKGNPFLGQKLGFEMGLSGRFNYQ